MSLYPRLTTEGIVVHRTEAGFTGAEVNVKEAPNSYNFFIDKNGKYDEMIDREYPSAHALKFNHSTISIALYGDFAELEHSRNNHPTEDQLSALVRLCVELRSRFGPIWIKGHSELGPDGTSFPEKLQFGHTCPGELLDLDQVRARVIASENGAQENFSSSIRA